MNITTLMVSFLLYLQNEGHLGVLDAEKILDSPRDKHFLVFQWMDFRQWDLYQYMQEALEQFIRIEKQKSSKSRRK